MRAWGYVRVSTPGQVEHGYSVEDQEQRIREYCPRRGYALQGLVYDAGESGRLAQRPGLVELLKRAEAREYDVLVPVNIDRFGRENRIILNTTHALQQAGIVIDYVEHGIAETPEQQFSLEVQGAVAGLEWAKIRARMLRGKAGKARAGRIPVNCTIYGYDTIRKWQTHLPEFEGRDGELVINESEAAIVRELFRRYADQGLPLRQLCRWLMDEHVPTKTGRSVWWPAAVQYMLRNETYTGRFWYGRTRSRSVERDGKKMEIDTPAPRSDWVEIPCPRIVDEALWQRAQERFRGGLASRGGRRSVDAALGALVFCGLCKRLSGEGPLRCSAQRGSRDPSRPAYHRLYYQCNSARRPDQSYCGTLMSARKLEPLVYREALRLTEPGVLAGLVRERIAARLAAIGDVGTAIARREAELKRLEGQEERIADLILSGVSQAVVQRRLANLNGRREVLESELRDLRREAGSPGDPEAAAKQAAALAAAKRVRLLAAEGKPAALRAEYESFLVVHVAKGKKPRVEVLDHLLYGKER